MLGLAIQIKAQQATVAAGGQTPGTGVSVAYSVGQVFYNTTNGINVSVSQGVQQTYKCENCPPIKPALINNEIPQVFTPNGDGVNDNFFIKDIEKYPNNTLEIFNRWGDKVFTANPYTNTWDGKSEKGLNIGNDVLPVGTYFYVLNLGDGSKIIKGNVYLTK